MFDIWSFYWIVNNTSYIIVDASFCEVILATKSNALIEVDGEHRTFQDDSLDNFVGNWKVTFDIVKQSIEHSCDAEKGREPTIFESAFVEKVD